jgi:hypothetical protein
MNRLQPPDIDDLITVVQAAEEFNMGESTAWLLIKRHNVPRYRRAGFGKRTFVRRSDFADAYQTPVPVEDRAKKLAA